MNKEFLRSLEEYRAGKRDDSLALEAYREADALLNAPGETGSFAAFQLALIAEYAAGESADHILRENIRQLREKAETAIDWHMHPHDVVYSPLEVMPYNLREGRVGVLDRIPCRHGGTCLRIRLADPDGVQTDLLLTMPDRGFCGFYDTLVLHTIGGKRALLPKKDIFFDEIRGQSFYRFGKCVADFSCDCFAVRFPMV